MALSRVHTWSAGEVLTASDLNAEINNILTNPTSLIAGISPTFATITATLSVIGGTATNDSATAGNLGEYIAGALAPGSATALTTATPKTVTSISLTAGDWDVNGVVGFVPAATTNITALVSGVSIVANTLGAEGTFINIANATTGIVPGVNNFRMPAPTTRISLASTTTVYLIASAGFSVDTLAAFGNIRARRVR